LIQKKSREKSRVYGREKIVELIRELPEITMSEIAEIPEMGEVSGKCQNLTLQFF